MDPSTSLEILERWGFAGMVFLIGCLFIFSAVRLTKPFIESYRGLNVDLVSQLEIARKEVAAVKAENTSLRRDVYEIQQENLRLQRRLLDLEQGTQK